MLLKCLSGDSCTARLCRPMSRTNPRNANSASSLFAEVPGAFSPLNTAAEPWQHGVSSEHHRMFID